MDNWNFKFDSDPAKCNINADLIGYFVKNAPLQNSDTDFTLSGRLFGDKNWHVQKEYFTRTEVNGEKVKQDWLIYSPSAGKVFCYVCKLFSKCVSETQFQVDLMIGKM